MADTIEIIQGTATVVEVAGPTGPQGPAGATGATGSAGAAGQGVPIGGTTGQVLRKASGTNYDTEWAAAGSGSGSVTSVALAGTGLSISGSPITGSGTITANVSYGTTAGTATQGNDTRIADIAASSITTKQGANSGGAGGTITMRGGITGTNGPGGNSGSINLQGSDDEDEGAFNGGSINLSAGTGHGGSITSVGVNQNGGGSLTMSGGGNGAGGDINTSNAGGAINTSNEGGGISTINGGGAINTADGGGSIDTSDGGGAIDTSGFEGAAGGDILTHGGGEGAGGSVETYDGGGSISTRGTGSLGLGSSGTRTTFTGTATANRAIALPDASGTLTLQGAITTSGLTQSTDRILGRTTASTGAVEEITVGSGLSLSAGQLSATASGGVTTGSVDNAIIRADGTGGSTSQSSDLKIDDATTTTQNNVAITNQHSGQTNSALVLTPKGTGAFIAGPKPDGVAAVGGNARGASAVDLQLARTAATQVASGANAFVVGQNNTASGASSFVFGGSCSGTGINAIAGGAGSSAGNRCVALGNSASASGDSAVALGGFGPTASAQSSIALCDRTLADRWSMLAHAAGRFAANGDAQSARFVLRCKTTTNSAVEMALDGSTTYLTIPSGKVIFANIQVVGVSSTGGTVATFERQYAAKNVAGTSSEVFAAVTVGTDNAAGTSLEVATVDAGDYIRIRPTGVSSTIFRWVASVDAVEVAYGT